MLLTHLPLPSLSNGTLWSFHIAIENGHLHRVFQKEMVVFHSYVNIYQKIQKVSSHFGGYTRPPQAKRCGLTPWSLGPLVPWSLRPPWPVCQSSCSLTGQRKLFLRRWAPGPGAVQRLLLSSYYHVLSSELLVVFNASHNL